MRKHPSLALALLIVTTTASVASAKPFRPHEIALTGLAGELVVGDFTRFELGVNYLHALTDMFQIGGSAQFVHIADDGPDVTNARFLVAGRVNFPASQSRADAFFVNAGVGVNHAAVGDLDDNELALTLTVGKRFALWERLSYSPEMGLVILGDELAFAIQFLAVSVHF